MGGLAASCKLLGDPPLASIMDSRRVRPRIVGECRVACVIANGSLSAPVRRSRNTWLVLRRR
jgi:hypothetical protein